MSKIEVDAIEPQSGTSLTLGASGDTLTIPSGATLVNNGTASGFGDNLEWQSSIVTAATITVTANKGYWIDTTSNACTITLPAAAAVGDRLIFTDYLRTWGTNAVTINQNSLKFQGGTVNPVYNTSGQSVDIVYSGVTQGWIPNSDDDSIDTQFNGSAEYLVVAGGGGGGNNDGGGGGAGGLLTNYGGSAITLTQGNTYTITVGGGGAGVSGENSGSDGENSVLSGTGITTVTAIGGGGGAGNLVDGRDGGSGGGTGKAAGSAGSGTVGQGNNGGGTGGSGGGGGGGAGAVGATGSSGAGGAGLANSITGSSVTYAGGGGGTPSASGGSGGGGAGANTASAGTVNTGGGGGGGNTASGAGGSGIVILRLLTTDFSGTTTGSPTESTSGLDTILSYTSSGSYTA